MLRLLSAFFALWIIILSGSAGAETPFWGERQKLVFVAKTSFSGESRLQSLCAQAIDFYAFFLPVRRNLGDYVFSSDHCVTQDVTMIPKDRFHLFQAAGVIPDQVPLKPDVAIAWSSRTKMIVTILACMGVMAPLFYRRLRRGGRACRTQISGDPIYYDVLTSVMFHTARTDGVIEKADIDVIRATFAELTCKPMSSEMMAKSFAEVLSDDTILNLVKAYRGTEAEVLIDAAIIVATRNGFATREKIAFLKRMNEALERDTSWIQTVLNKGPRPAAPTEA